MKIKMADKMRSNVCGITLFLLFGNVYNRDSDLMGDYCRGRPVECCPGRNDECTVPILGTLCYCDIFCNRDVNPDCCPDYSEVCEGIPEPDPQTETKCVHKDRLYSTEESFEDNCNTCTCRGFNHGAYNFYCSKKPCLIRADIIEGVNKGNYGWISGNYSFLWGKTLEEGIQQRLGTFPPSISTINMTEIHTPMTNYLPKFFDSRLKWASWLQPVRDQGDCGASWAFSSAALTSDRLAIMSGGLWKVDLSPQMLISCQKRAQNGCTGGHLDRAWWFLRKHGTSSESCHPYHSGRTLKPGSCRAKRRRDPYSKIPKVQCADGSENILYLSTPPYRTAAKENVIMQEIFTNGPVQAVFRVKEDFYSYKSGVYRYAHLSETLPQDYRQEAWHSIRIIGWGEDSLNNVPVKYWEESTLMFEIKGTSPCYFNGELCANSWGENWGEDGYFRILRGANECDVESFVVGVWANLEEFDDRKTLDPIG